MVAGGGASVIYADTVWISLFRPQTLLQGVHLVLFLPLCFTLAIIFYALVIA